MGKTVKIGLLGCGTVGGGVIIVLNENRDDIARKAGCTIEVNETGNQKIQRRLYG